MEDCTIVMGLVVANHHIDLMAVASICVPIKLATSRKKGSFLFYTNKEAESLISEKPKIFSAFAPSLIEALNSVKFGNVILSPFDLMQRSCKLVKAVLLAPSGAL